MIKLLIFIVAYMIIGVMVAIATDRAIGDGEDRSWLIPLWGVCVVIAIPFGILCLLANIAARIGDKIYDIRHK
jgi:hypothetical protein